MWRPVMNWRAPAGERGLASFSVGRPHVLSKSPFHRWTDWRRETGSAARRGRIPALPPSEAAGLEQARVLFLGSNGRFTALMKQLGTLSREEKPAAGKAINTAKAELEAMLAERRQELELKAALPQEPTDFTLPGRRRPLGKLH